MNTIMETSRNKSGKKLIIGLILLFVGFAIIAKQFNLIPYDLRNVLFTWQTFLIILGVIFVTTNENRATGYIIMLVGAIFLIPDIFDVPYNLYRLFWPAILVIAGLALIFGGTFRMKRHDFPSEFNADYIDDINIFGGHNRILTGKFHGGSIVSIFGGGKYDLRQTTPAEGTNTLEVVNIFGGCNLIVPPDWNVKIEVVAIFGGFSDKRMVSNTSAEKRVIVKGIALFGGGEITS